MTVVADAVLAWPRTTLSPSAAWAVAGRARASAASTAARAFLLVSPVVVA
jgi:hypothetical protein